VMAVSELAAFFNRKPDDFFCEVGICQAKLIRKQDSTRTYWYCKKCNRNYYYGEYSTPVLPAIIKDNVINGYYNYPEHVRETLKGFGLTDKVLLSLPCFFPPDYES
jgi:hypothetical protein